MNTDERKAAIRDMLNSMIKADTETAEKHIHDVITAKTRERLNPSTDEGLTATDDDTDDAATGEE